ncbi:MAG: helix-turn-helix transcriptional regulator [Deltaproteobacteria bacterium]|nr:helix-turn-helix transcriptional regulator [Deltaproteobacteria bacterium]
MVESRRDSYDQSALTPSSLTPRQAEVLARTQAGLTSKEIAFELGLAHSTVRVLLARALGKGFSRRTSMVRHESAPASLQDPCAQNDHRCMQPNHRY